MTTYKILKNVMIGDEVTPLWVYQLDENDIVLEFDTEEEAEVFSSTYTHPHKIVKWVDGSPV
jgi:hypothetical protein